MERQEDPFDPVDALSRINAWYLDRMQRVRQQAFVDFIHPDRYPRPVGALIERDENGRWDVQQVARWNDALEAELRYGELAMGHWSHLEWVA